MNRPEVVDRALRWLRPDATGTAFGALFFCASLTPSLLPRDWVTAGIIGGINAAIGYGIGALASAVVRKSLLRNRSWWPPQVPVRYGLQVALTVVALGGALLMVVPAAAWQR